MFDGNTFTQFGTIVQTFTELGRTTLGSGNTNINVSGLPSKKWLIILVSITGTSSNATSPFLRFNNDSGSNYADRWNLNGGTDTTNTSASGIRFNTFNGNNFFVFFVENSSSTNEKLVLGYQIDADSTGAANAPSRFEVVGKWTNTSNAITEVDFQFPSQTFNTGSEVVVLGADPSDTSVTPFFKELGRTSWSSGGTISNTFTAKKYLLTTLEATINGSANHVGIQFNSDTGANYADRFSLNGGADSTQTSVTTNYFTASDHPSQTLFSTAFILNISSSEKLSIVHGMYSGASGAGNVPNRDEIVGKWANTSNQITTISAKTDAGAFTEGELVVYGEN